MSRDYHPRIYVASLSDYNAGRLHGVWIVLSDGIDACWRTIEAMLASSPEPGAEEWAIHDYEDFGPVRLHEFENLEMVTKLAQGIARHGEAYACWADHLGSSSWDELDRFEEVFRGTFTDVRQCADDLLDNLGIDLDPNSWAPSLIAAYVRIDVDAFAHDLQHIFTVCEGHEGVHIFDP